MVNSLALIDYCMVFDSLYSSGYFNKYGDAEARIIEVKTLLKIPAEDI